MAHYLPIAVVLMIGLSIPVIGILVSWALAPRKFEPGKAEPYECGVESAVEARETVSLRYYLIAVLFVIFDVETIFLFPWAVKYRFLGLFGFIEMALFIAILLLGYVYVWKKGALEWA
jgi:NADH-quinone oxidoreductase subunit A